MGRPRKPTKLKELEGTVQPCRMVPNEPDPDPEIPNPPDVFELDGPEMAEWRRITPLLFRLGLLTAIDRTELANYCTAYGRWYNAQEALKTQDVVFVTDKGNVIQNPLVGISNKSMELMHKFLAEFGMTPASRARVSANPKSVKKEDPWASKKTPRRKQ